MDLQFSRGLVRDPHRGPEGSQVFRARHPQRGQVDFDYMNLEFLQTDGPEPVNGTRATYGCSWR